MMCRASCSGDVKKPTCASSPLRHSFSGSVMNVRKSSPYSSRHRFFEPSPPTLWSGPFAPTTGPPASVVSHGLSLSQICRYTHAPRGVPTDRRRRPICTTADFSRSSASNTDGRSMSIQIVDGKKRFASPSFAITRTGPRRSSHTASPLVSSRACRQSRGKSSDPLMYRTARKSWRPNSPAPLSRSRIVRSPARTNWPFTAYCTTICSSCMRLSGVGMSASVATSAISSVTRSVKMISCWPSACRPAVANEMQCTTSFACSWCAMSESFTSGDSQIGRTPRERIVVGVKGCVYGFAMKYRYCS
eukprot:Rhum_TRINITY_DN14639_c18_g1::Rhum_TRINITY_DN14639_c18_g1_i1::g.106803::m.106803